MTSTQGETALRRSEARQISPNQTRKSLFTGASRSIRELVKIRKAEMMTKIKSVNISCGKCDMKLSGEYPEHEAIPMIKEFKRLHEGHDIKLSFFKRIKGVIFSWI